MTSKKTGKVRIVHTVGSARDYRLFQLGHSTTIADDESMKRKRKNLSRGEKRIQECQQLLRSLCGIQVPDRAEPAGTLKDQADREARLARHRTPRTPRELGRWVESVAPRVANPEE